MGGAVRKKHVGRGLVLVGAVAISLLAQACAAPSGGGGGPSGPTTTTTTSTTLPWTTPTGLTTFITLTCNAVFEGTLLDQFTQNASVNVKAPLSVPTGSNFYITVAPGTFTPPEVVEGYFIENINNFQIYFALPAGTEFVDSVMTESFNTGPGYPSLTLDDRPGDADYLIYTVPGPFEPGTVVQMPQVRIELKAIGTPGSVITTSLSVLGNAAQFSGGVVGNTCWPDFAWIFSTTAITAAP